MTKSYTHKEVAERCLNPNSTCDGCGKYSWDCNRGSSKHYQHACGECVPCMSLEVCHAQICCDDFMWEMHRKRNGDGVDDYTHCTICGADMTDKLYEPDCGKCEPCLARKEMENGNAL